MSSLRLQLTMLQTEVSSSQVPTYLIIDLGTRLQYAAFFFTNYNLDLHRKIRRLFLLQNWIVILGFNIYLYKKAKKQLSMPPT